MNQCSPEWLAHFRKAQNLLNVCGKQIFFLTWPQEHQDVFIQIENLAHVFIFSYCSIQGTDLEE